MIYLQTQNEKINKALQLIYQAHKGQKRKYTNEDYIIHPLSVASLISTITTDEDNICASLLHDVCEPPCIIPLDYIKREFGIITHSIVKSVTNTTTSSDGNRHTRKLIYRNQLGTSSDKAKTIKLADIIDNIKSINLFDPKFANLYMKEQFELIPILVSGDSELYHIAEKIVNNYFKTTAIDDTENVIGNFWR